MPTQVGWIDDNGHPKLKIRVNGTHPTAEAFVDALIDTGFTGFLMLPISVALPLGLPLYGTGDFVLADGQTVTHYIAEGSVTIAPPSEGMVDELVPETCRGSILLGGDTALLGMEFLRSLNKLLLVGAVVLLMDHAEHDL